MKVVSHPAMAHLHPTGHHLHPENPERLARLFERFPEVEEGAAATRAQIELVHTPDYVGAVDSLTAETWLDGDTVAGPTTWEAARLAAGELAPGAPAAVAATQSRLQAAARGVAASAAVGRGTRIRPARPQTVVPAPRAAGSSISRAAHAPSSRRLRPPR